ncbi:DnaA ATPase domain-containing protein [Amphiplicatus metriothermophilus]|uniref:Chromosomal replication initiator protein DnaA n=1 Tax=Amphiplicatus metriothermophilus TaxID=1519374 RepID=A0A239PZ87_9PROT|nr:DnaA/Hda family protein [Amphiplicatus metriothermophilus]MBB5518209.1 chromosomal replication initiator protein [Amphiplicatus metriothermophilus]SNT75388.1 chromosomal replication initiator protein DnaA [Amphiplicatus metriothermophilus]
MNEMGGGEEFSAFMKRLQLRVGGNAFQAWMSDLRLESRTPDAVTFSTASKAKCDVLVQRFIQQLQDAWRDAVAPVRRIDVVTREMLSASAARVDALGPAAAAGGSARAYASAPAASRRAYSTAPATNARRGAAALAELVSPLDARCTFERFAVDPSNELAYAAARQLVNPNGVREIVYIYGPSGVGKTHLLHAIGNEWAATRNAEGCAYLTYSNLKNGCVNAIFSNAMLALQQALLAQGVVLIDDVHLLASSVRTQMEILNLVNASLAAGRRLVLAGELAPARLVERGISPRLADRLKGGLCVAMSPGGEALRFDVLKKRLDGAPERCAISDEALAFIARHFPQSMREAIGALNQLLLVFGRQEVTVDAAMAAEALRAHLRDCRREYTLDDAAEASAKAFGITLADLKGRAQHQKYVRARHAFVFVGREVLKESFPRIAAVLGRDHSTAMNGYQRALALIVRDKKFQDGVEAVKAALGA